MSRVEPAEERMVTPADGCEGARGALSVWGRGVSASGVTRVSDSTWRDDSHWASDFTVVQAPRSAASVRLKRALDLSCSLILIAVLAPVLGLVGLVVAMTSRGPILYRQVRVGKRGRAFAMFKFRTMRRGADQQRDALLEANVYGDPRLFKLASDPRVTRVGKILRRTSLDELPQLFNVLRGEMSLVGPRPPLPSEVELYEERHFTRLQVLPGITGPWQVSGRNLITDFEEVVRLEREYIEQWSIARDVQILLATIPAVIFMRGAQ